MLTLGLGYPPVDARAQELAPTPPACGRADPSARRLPFSAEANADGARYVWFTNCLAGMPFPYTPTKQVPASSYFVEIAVTADSSRPRAGDIAWWPAFMGVIASDTGPVLTAGDRPSLHKLTIRFGSQPRFFRRLVPRDD